MRLYSAEPTRSGVKERALQQVQFGAIVVDFQRGNAVKFLLSGYITTTTNFIRVYVT